jgi:hypothetical protein
MTRRLASTLAIVTGCWLASAASAEAGFIAAGVDLEATSGGLLSSMSGSEHQSPVSPALELLVQRQAAWANPFAPTSAGSAGAPGTTPSSGGPPAADLLPVAAAVPSGLVTRLAAEREVWLPPAFSTGIFRPPRV